MKILIIDGDESFVSDLKKRIRKLGYDVDVVFTGKEGLKRIADQFFDLVFIEVFLPDGKGYEFIPEFLKKKPLLKIVAMTFDNSMTMELRVREQNIMYYLIKPFEDKELKGIFHHLNNARAKGSLHINDRK